MTDRHSPDLFERIRFRGNPVAHPNSIVLSGNARFTVLTPRLIRLEWSEAGEHEDRGTYAFPTRRAPTPPALNVRLERGDLVIDTGALILHYAQDGGRFSAENLSIAFELAGERQVWVSGTPDRSNLRGTRRTLDGCEGDAALDQGILSRAGWALFDDSRSVVFGAEDGWVAPRPDHELVDWYFFGYGHDYKGALAEYTRFGGPIPLIPRFVLGAWWSRYWAYSEQDLKDLVGEFEQHDVPLDVLVIDMDWHTPHAWTGYTWNRELFPDPPAFLKWAHDKGLRATLNLHPAQGVGSFEEFYPRFAEAMGVDPQSGAAIPFRITDRRFVQNYFELIHHPMEEDGVDFWWVDWQQGESSEVKGLDPLLWLNHLHFTDSARRGKRPMLYSRWGGLGNHRYHIGFSGDTIVVWPALQFQPYFTATAANVAYGWWSHDIGGHMGGATEPELYARWVQFGALSPCLRLHSTKDPRAERRPWAYPDEVYEAAKSAFHWRYQLVPYIYSMARVASDTSVALCRPMYYEYPDKDAAYVARYQYFFGDQMIAAPIVHPADPETGVASTDVWVPEGTWIDYTTRETFTGPRWVRLVGGLDRMPMLMRSGAILPLAFSFRGESAPGLASGSTDAIPPDSLVLSVFPGAQGKFRLYEDDGITEAYRESQYEWTEITTRMEDDRTWVVHIAPVEGGCDTLPRERQLAILLEGSRQPQSVLVDGVGTTDWDYHPETLTTTVHIPMRDKRKPLTVTAWCGTGMSALGPARNEEVARADVWRLLGDRCPQDAGDIQAVLRVDAPGRADAIARLSGPFVRVVEYTTPEEASQRMGRVIVGAPVPGSEPYDIEAVFTLFRGPGPEQHRVHIKRTSQSHILDVPFAVDGQARTMRWEAEVQVTWRGETLRHSHQSTLSFPAIYAWRVLVYNRDDSPLVLEEVMDKTGVVDQDLDWRAYVQTVERARNTLEPHALLFFREYRQALQDEEPLAAYATTTVTSPDEREVVLQFRSGGPSVLYLNGQQLSEVLVEERENEGRSPFRQVRKTEPVRLRGGENTLLIDTRPPAEGRPFWFFAAGFTTLDDDPMTDLTFQ